MATGTIILPVFGCVYDTTNPPGLSGTTLRPMLLFDATTDEIVGWQFRVPENHSNSADPVLKIQYSMVSAVAGDTPNSEVVFSCEVMCVTDGETIDSDSYDTINVSTATTVPATAGLMDEISLTLSNNDSMAAGDYCALRFRRDADNAGDDAAGDAEVWAVAFEYTTS